MWVSRNAMPLSFQFTWANLAKRTVLCVWCGAHRVSRTVSRCDPQRGRAVFILVAWVVIGAYLIVRAYTSRLRVTKEHEPDQQYGTSVSLNRALSQR